MTIDDTAPGLVLDSLRKLAYLFATRSLALAAMGKDDQTPPSTTKTLQDRARGFGKASQALAAMGKDDVNIPRTPEQLAAVEEWQRLRYDTFLQQDADLQGVGATAVAYPPMELLRKVWVPRCVKITAQRGGYAPEEATLYGGMTACLGGAVQRVAPVDGGEHHKVHACSDILSDGSNADDYKDALHYDLSIFKGPVELHMITDLSMADAVGGVRQNYLVFSSTAKTPGTETAVIKGVYDLVENGTIRAPHTLQLPDGGGGLGPSLHAEDAAIKARREAEKLRASGVDVTCFDIALRVKALDAAALCFNRKKEIYLAVGLASEKDDNSPVWLEATNYYDKAAELVVRYTNVSKGLAGRLHLVGGNLAVDTKLYTQ